MASYRITQSGIGAMMTSPGFWFAFLSYGAIGLSVAGLFYFSVGRPDFAALGQSARPLRLYITANLGFNRSHEFCVGRA
ncbi:MAG: hypothetical protein WDM80_17680 [Limisphaerales bacterium]